MKYRLYSIALAVLLTACGEPDKPTVSLYLAMQRSDIDQFRESGKCSVGWTATVSPCLRAPALKSVSVWTIESTNSLSTGSRCNALTI